MRDKPKDEEYYQRQLNIGSLLIQAYLDKYILDSIDEFKLSVLKENPTWYWQHHIYDGTYMRFN